MKKAIRKVALYIYIKALMMHGKWILKCQVAHLRSIFCHAYIHTFSLFPNRKLNYNTELALKVRQIVCDLPEPNNIQTLENDDVEKLLLTLIEDQQVKLILTNYFRLVAYYYSYGKSSNSFKDQIDRATEQASKYSDTIEPISLEEAGVLNKTIKKTHKELKHEIRRLNSERLEQEKLQLIEPIEIGRSHVIFSLSLFTSLFLISGFTYVKLFFGGLGFKVSDFFSATDYISSSIDVLLPTVISTFLGLGAMLLGLSFAIDDKLYEDQFETSLSRRGEYAFLFIIIFIAFGLVEHSYRTGELASIFLGPLIIIIGMFTFPRLSIWRYIKNKVTVGAVFFSVFYFTVHLGLNIKDEINEVKSGDFKSPYEITYIDAYSEFSDHEYLAGNSNFAFLYYKPEKKVIVIPRLAIKEISPK